MREVLAIVLTCVLSAAARAQDPVEVDPAHYKVAFENDCVRVLRVHYDPGAKSVMHDHPEGVAVALAEAQVQFSQPDGSVSDRQFAAGEAVWAPAGAHVPENVGDGPVEVVLVELKPKAPAACQPPAEAATEAEDPR